MGPEADKDNSPLGICMYRFEGNRSIQWAILSYTDCIRTYQHPPHVTVVGWSPLADEDGNPVRDTQSNDE
jgi:hypothetical protein